MKISLDEFKKVEIRAGKILSAEKVPNTDKLLKLTVDFGEKVEIEGQVKSVPRQIISGIALRFPDPAVLVGKTCMFVTNLEPRMIKGLESNGMLFAVSTPEGGFSLLEPNESILPGTLAV
jgi:methionine--tRNA ligase beta chain